jgi:hypothetical protein
MAKKDPRPSNGKVEADLIDELRKLSISAAHEVLSGIDRLKDLRSEWEDGDHGLGPESKKQRERAKSLAYELAHHEVKHAETILRLSHQQADMLFDHARHLVRRVRTKTDEKLPPRVIEVQLKKVEAADREANENYRGRESFEIKNPFTEAADGKATKIKTFADQSGNDDNIAGLEAKVTFQPSRVPANANGVVEITITAKQEPAEGIFFADLIISLVGDVERQVAHRLVRVRYSKSSSEDV